jgi:hypothetical protein
MSLFAVYEGLFEIAREDHDLVSVFEDLESAVKCVDKTVELEGISVYSLYVVEFESGESLTSGKVVYEIEGNASPYN